MNTNLYRTGALLLALILPAVTLAGCGGEPGVAAGAPLLGQDLQEELIRCIDYQLVLVGPEPSEFAVTGLGDEVSVAFRHDFPADLNRSGIVDGWDVFPLAANFGESAELNPCFDPNRDGVIDGSDLFVIGSNFGRRIDGYQVYSSEDEDSGTHYKVNDELLPYKGCGEVVEFTLGLKSGFYWYYVRSVNESSGMKSHEVEALAEGVINNQPPRWIDTVGVQQVVGLIGGLNVYWNEAEDLDSKYVHYFIYVDKRDPIPLDDCEKVIEVTSPTTAAYYDFVKTVTLLDEKTEYNVIVRAGEDDRNTVTLSAVTQAKPLSLGSPDLLAALPTAPGEMTLYYELATSRSHSSMDVVCDTRSPIPFDGQTVIYADVEEDYLYSYIYRCTIGGLEPGRTYFFKLIQRWEQYPAERESQVIRAAATGWPCRIVLDDRDDPLYGYWQDLAFDEDGNAVLGGATHYSNSPGLIFEEEEGWDESYRYYNYQYDRLQNPHLSLSPGGLARLLFYREEQGVNLAEYDGSAWQVRALMEADVRRAVYCFKPEGDPQVAWLESDDDVLRFGEEREGAWSADEIADIGLYSRLGGLGLTGGGAPLIACTWGWAQEVRVAEQDGAGWSFETAAPADPQRPYGPPALAIDSGGDPVLAFAADRLSHHEIIVARRTDGEWTSEVVFSGPESIDGEIALAAGPDGRLAVLAVRRSLEQSALTVISSDGAVWAADDVYLIDESFGKYDPKHWRMKYDPAGRLQGVVVNTDTVEIILFGEGAQ